MIIFAAYIRQALRVLVAVSAITLGRLNLDHTGEDLPYDIYQ